MATIKDVAREAGVTSATVSYVLNNSGRVSEATRRRVLDVARRLNYRPSITAQNLRSGESRIIGYAWHVERPGEWTPIMQQFLYNMSKSAEEAGYHVLTFIADPDDPAAAYVTLAEMQRVDGFVLANTVVDDPRIRQLLDLGIPFVSFGRANDAWDFSYVDVDGTDGMRQVVRHLAEQGHERIAFVRWPPLSLAGNHRYQGYCDAMAELGLPIDERWLIEAENTPADGRIAAQKLMAQPPDSRPTAIACVSDVVAIGVMHALREMGLAIGREVAVTGFDNIPAAEHFTPALTSVHQPLDTIGHQLMTMLLDILQGSATETRQVLIRPHLVVRASSVRVSGEDGHWPG